MQITKAPWYILNDQLYQHLKIETIYNNILKTTKKSYDIAEEHSSPIIQKIIITTHLLELKDLDTTHEEKKLKKEQKLNKQDKNKEDEKNQTIFGKVNKYLT